MKLSIIQDYGAWPNESCLDTLSLHAPKCSHRWIPKRDREKETYLKCKNNISTNKNRIAKWFWVSGLGEGNVCKHSGLWGLRGTKCSGRCREDPSVASNGEKDSPARERKLNPTHTETFYWGNSFIEEDRWKDKALLTEAETTPLPPPKERGQRWELRKEDTETKRDWKLKLN